MQNTFVNRIPFRRLIIFILLVALYTSLAMRIPLNSDGASSFLEARDAAAGNILLSGWDLSTVSYYFTELLPYAFLIKLTGWHLAWFYVGPAVLLALVVMLAERLCLKGTPQASWPVLVLFAAPSLFAASLVLVPTIHMATYTVSLGCWLLVEEYRKHRGNWRLAILWLLLSVSLSSDGITRYCLLLPLFAASIFRIIKHQERHLCCVIGCVLAAEITSKVIQVLMTALGAFNVQGLSPTMFAQLDVIVSNLGLTLSGTIEYFHANFFGKPVSSWLALNNLLHAIVLAAVVAAFAFVIKRAARLDLISQGLLIGTCIMLFAYNMTNLAINIQTTRYLVPAFLFAIIAIVRNEKIPKLSPLAIIVIATFYAVITLPELTFNYSKTNGDFTVSRELERRGLHRGYAGFWSAAAISLPANMRIAPVDFGARVQPMNWLSKRQWYSEGGEFVICDTAGQVLIAQQQFGAASQNVSLGGKRLLIWSQGIRL